MLWMNSFLPLSVSALLLTLSTHAWAAPECRNLVIHMSDSTGSGESGTAVLICNGSELEMPGLVSVHMINGSENGLCYADYSCGNVESWCGAFHVGGRTLNLTFAEFLALRSWRHMSPDAPYAEVSVGLDFLQVRRHCTRTSEPVCVPMG